MRSIWDTNMMRCKAGWRVYPAVSLLILFWMGSGCSSTTRTQQGRPMVGVQTREDGSTNLPVLLTWANYDGLKDSDPEDAIVYFHDRCVGTGKAGFEAAFRSLAALPKRSAVVIAWKVSNSNDAQILRNYQIPYERLGLAPAFAKVVKERELDVTEIAL